MKTGTMGKTYADGEIIIREGDPGESMYVIQKGRVAVTRENDGRTIQLTLLEEGDIFGEMALFENELRSATVVAVGEAQVLTIDRRTFFRRVQEDPSLAFNIVETLSRRVRVLNAEVVRLRNQIALAPKD